MNFAFFLVRKGSLWHAKVMSHTNGCPTMEEWIWTNRIKEATDFLQERMP